MVVIAFLVLVLVMLVALAALAQRRNANMPRKAPLTPQNHEGYFRRKMKQNHQNFYRLHQRSPSALLWEEENKNPEEAVFPQRRWRESATQTWGKE
jgi:hypothetical protein